MIPTDTYVVGIREIFPEETNFLRYIIEKDASAFMQFYNDLKSFVVAHGPFDGIFGFSEGGGLAASLIAAQFEDPDSTFRFKCGVFFSAGPAVDLHALEHGHLKELDFASDGRSLKLPTVHIWDPQDMVHPGFGKSVRELCANEMMEDVKHGLGHEVPGRGSSQAVGECSRAINRTIERASVC